jgi:hypothetical protein
MTTRGLIQIYEKNGDGDKQRLLTNIYVHGDMYPNGVMCDVFKFLSNKTLASGYEPKKIFMQVNGMDDLAAQIITYLKNGHATLMKRLYGGGDIGGDIAAGYVYIYPNVKLRDLDVRYIYRIYQPKNRLYELANMAPAELAKLANMAPAELAYIPSLSAIGNGVDIPLTELGIKAYRYEWTEDNAKPQLIFSGKLRQYVKKYCAETA